MLKIVKLNMVKQLDRTLAICLFTRPGLYSAYTTATVHIVSITYLWSIHTYVPHRLLQSTNKHTDHKHTDHFKVLYYYLGYYLSLFKQSVSMVKLS